MEHDFILLEDRKSQLKERKTLYFTQACENIICYKPQDLNSCLDKLDALRQQGFYLAGFISYEAGYFFATGNLSAKNIYSHAKEFPLLHFQCFKNVVKLTPAEVDTLLYSQQLDLQQVACVVSDLKLNTQEEVYKKNFDNIKQHLQHGNTYQVNYTAKYTFNLQGDKVALYRTLRDRQKVEYSALMQLNDITILSFSPELFFKKQNNTITVKPMKGTMPRASCPAQDQLNQDKLHYDAKLIAENMIIVDLLRNDLGRLAHPGSVHVSKLLEICAYETLYQMTSTIAGTVPQQTSIKNILQNLFPCGSITGAPKIKTMQIIAELEQEPRKIYTGAIGYINPENDMCFNVAIRTLLLQDKAGELGVGGGIIYDSNAEEEFAELKLKAHFFTQMDPGFKLLESWRYDNHSGHFLLEDHLKRLKNSANILGFSFNELLIRKKLKELEVDINDDNKSYNLKDPRYKIRLVLTKNGDFKLTFIPIIETQTKNLSVILYENKCVQSQEILLQHKTTDSTVRCFFDTTKQQFAVNYDDVIFMNENGYITESSRANIFIELNNKLLTPPVDAGLLPGTMRAKILQENPNIIEKNLTKQDLIAATRIWLANSVRGMQQTELSLVYTQ